MSQIDMSILGIDPKYIKTKPYITDDEANKLYTLWANSNTNKDIVIADDKEVSSLSKKGFLSHKETLDGSSSMYLITNDGKQIIVEMVTNIPNLLRKDATMPSYTKIKTKAKRLKQTFTKKASLDINYNILVRIDGF